MNGLNSDARPARQTNFSDGWNTPRGSTDYAAAAECRVPASAADGYEE